MASAFHIGFFRKPRAASVLAAAVLAGCNPVPDKSAEARLAAAKAAYAAAEGAVPCALPGKDAFAPVCRIDRAYTQDGLYLTLRHPDGGFRRLLVTTDGRGVTAADGAEPAQVRLVGANEIEVALGDVRYHLPATVREAQP